MATLDLQGELGEGLEKDERGHNRGFVNFPIIQGVSSEEGDRFTLHQCFQTEKRSIIYYPMRGGHDQHVTRFLIKTVFKGAHFNSGENILFERVSVRFSDLEEWAGHRGIISTSTREGTAEEICRYRPVKPIEATLAEYGLQVRVVFVGPSISLSLQEVKISYETRLEIISLQKERPFEEYLVLIQRLQNFLSLAMGKPVVPLSIIGALNRETISDGDADLYYSDIEVFPMLGRYGAPEAEPRYSFQMLFTLSAIEKKMEKYLKNWWEKYDVFEPVINLYFAVLYNPHMYLENQFLALTQALETYHRRTMGGKYQTKEEFLEEVYPLIESAIPKALDRDYRESIKGRLKYLNEYSLRKRLVEILNSVKQEVPLPFVLNSKQRKQFVSKIVDIRNYWTHYPPNSNVKGAHDEWAVLIAQLQLILEAVFLKEIGFSSEEIWDMLQRSEHFQHIEIIP